MTDQAEDPIIEAAKARAISEDRMEAVAADWRSHDADAVRWRKALAHMNLALAYAEDMADGQRAMGEALSAALDTVAMGAPLHTAFGDVRDSASWWADTATPIEIEAYAGAALKAISRRPFAPRAKLRILVMIWESMSADEQLGFLRNVDPGGRYIGGAK